MSNAKPFLGETPDRSKAFPGIAALELSIVQDRWAHYTQKAWQRESRYSLADIPRHLRCVNPRCQQGGLDLQQVALFWSSGEYTMHCSGHEGSPGGRRKGDPCDNSFIVTIQKTQEGD